MITNKISNKKAAREKLYMFFLAVFHFGTTPIRRIGIPS
jgi:hypothetical protein